MSWTELFADFAATTSESFIDDPDKLINQATERAPILARFLKGSGADQVLKGGDQISFQTFFDEHNTAVNYGGANPEFAIENPNIVQTATIDWRFTADHMSWTDHEIGLQVNSSHSREHRERTIHKIYNIKEQRLATSIVKHMEGLLFRTPNGAEMEARGGNYQYSIPAIITEESDGLPVGWGQTTVESFSPTTHPGWKNQRATYAAYNDATVDGTNDLLAGMDQMMDLITYRPLPKYENQGEMKNRPNIIMTSSLGKRRMQDTLRHSNDRLVAAQDGAYEAPAFNGLGLVYASQLDAAALYNNGSDVAVAETAADITGPRYYFIDFDSMGTIFHDDRYFQKLTPEKSGTPNQPMSHVQWCDTWWQLACTERRKQGILSPSTDLT